MKTEDIKNRLEYLREELRQERISYGELSELSSLAQYIDPGDVELLEAAGVPEFEENKTTVIFRKFKDGEVIALFPYESYNGSVGTCLSYLHCGQHGPATLGIIQDTKLCTPEEYEPLQRELISIGYNLEINRRVNWDKHVSACYEMKKELT